jgi:hypothetical protein
MRSAAHRALIEQLVERPAPVRNVLMGLVEVPCDLQLTLT